MFPQINDLGEKVPASDDNSIISFESGNMTIYSVSKKDHGTWQCVLTNAVASITHDVMLYVKCKFLNISIALIFCGSVFLFLNSYF